MHDGLCNNCATRLAGPYCHQCGQKEVDEEWRSAGAIVRQFWSEASSFDSKSLRSLAAVCWPGHLTAEFVAGRRARYLAPLKIYFLCAALFFVVGPTIAGFTFDHVLAQDADGTFATAVDQHLASTGTSREILAERYNAASKTVYTLSPILSVLAMMILLRVFYRRWCPRLGPHAVFAVHYVAFFYLAAIVTGAVNQMFSPGPWIVLALMQGTLLVYLFLALRRVHREPSGRAFAKAAALLILTFAIDSPINMAARMLTLACA